MEKLLLLGDEAIAQGALDAGISGIYAYPGTPSTEITEYVQRSKQARETSVRSAWSSNEKTAMEAAIGMSYAGKRAMVCMKHVGLNVAADAFMNSAVTGANGGLVFVSADDPSMHSSQNEQDSRFFGKFAMMPVLEPSNQQEAYDMAHYGFELSEKFETPVLMRITTRLAHSRADVTLRDKVTQNECKLPDDLKQFVLLPAIARKRYKLLLDNQNYFEEASDNSGFNKYIDADDKKIGIITTGIAYNYLMENFEDGKVPHPVLKITQYPLPKAMIEKMAAEVDEMYIFEEGAPIVEEMIRGFLNKGIKVRGRLDGLVPRDGELNPNLVAKAVGKEITKGNPIPDIVMPRPPKLCDGCPHIFSYNALNEALEEHGTGRVMSDIGCYTLGALEPFNAINSCVDMGASVTMAKGASDAGMHPVVGVIGDSTFTHSGMTGLLDCINDKTPVTIMILDNETTGMTGGQKSSALGRLEQICLGLGVEKEHLHVINPVKKEHDANVTIIKNELAYKGVSVIIPRRECLVTLTKSKRAAKKSK